MSNDISIINNELELAKKSSNQGTEIWFARIIQQILGYKTWRSFEEVIDRAVRACESTGVDAKNHFAKTHKMVSIGSDAERRQPDFILSRYACYLIAMNGDSSKPEIGVAQTYFAIQTRRMEIVDSKNETEERINLRSRVKENNKKLNDAAKEAGVIRYGLFHNAGYQGLYSMSLKDIKEFKGLNEKDDLLDYSGRAELAANDFRITQAELRLRNENGSTEQNAINIHRTVGEEVRKTMENIGKTMPEDLPIEQSIKKLASERKKILK